MTWRVLPDLAVRTRGGSVVAANDETFGEKENLIRPEAPRFQPHTFGHRGQIMDGWETRRRREPGDDWAIVRLGVGGLVRGALIDTSWFTGNYPPDVSVEAAWLDPLASDPPEVEWVEVIPRSPISGDAENAFDIDHDRLATHVRLRQYPDGGIARLRVHGEPVGDPRWVAGRSFDLAAMEHGGQVLDCSNRFYAAPDNVLAPGAARVMGEGWETRRRRETGNDWVTVRLAAAGVIGAVEIDTTHFIGNAPGWASLTGIDGAAENAVLLPHSPLRPDTVNRFVLPPGTPVRDVRLDIVPDGGVARLRAWGSPTGAGRATMFLAWFNRLPAATAASALAGWGGADEEWAGALTDGRPYADADRLAAVTAELPGRAPDPDTWSALVGRR